MRYFFLREVPFGQDGNYSHEAIVNRINADLANDLGNLAQRSLSMIAKNCDGVVPEPGELQRRRQGDPGAGRRAARAWRARRWTTQQIHQALDAVWAVVAEANRYFAGEEPWALAKTDPARMETVLYVTAEVVRQVAHPGAAGHAGRRRRSCSICLGVPADERDFRGAWRASRIEPGTALPAPTPVFPRYVEPTAG